MCVRYETIKLLDAGYSYTTYVMSNVLPGNVGFGYDLSNFSYPNLSYLEFTAWAVFDGGHAFFEIGGGYSSNFDYSIKFDANIFAETPVGIDVLGANSLKISIAYHFTVVGATGFNSTSVSNLKLDNTS